MKALNHTCQGASHIAANKVCQDASSSFASDSMSVAIVSDGHGGDRYFRSDIGSRFAVEATRECVEAFVEQVDISVFRGKPFTQRPALSSSSHVSDNDADAALRQLFSSIIFHWRAKVMAHKQDFPLTDKERDSIDPKYVADFNSDIDVEKAYGCTLLCAVITPHFFFAFHIGDGKCVAFDSNAQWSEPIPWDDNCFLNKTTSLCDASALNEFRFCYCADGSSPLALFLGSDGIDDSFGPADKMVNFYVNILKELNAKGIDDTLLDLQSTLPDLSKRGSHDDMSIACLFNDALLPSKITLLVDWQRQNIKSQISDVNSRIQKRVDSIKRLNEQLSQYQRLQIDLNLAKKELAQAFDSKRVLAQKYDAFSMEINPDNFTPYNDPIGLDNPLSQSPAPDSSLPIYD